MKVTMLELTAGDIEVQVYEDKVVLTFEILAEGTLHGKPETRSLTFSPAWVSLEVKSGERLWGESIRYARFWQNWNRPDLPS